MTVLLRSVLSAKGWGVTTVPPTMALLDVVDLLVAKHIGAAPVVDENGVVLGLISERDIVSGLADHHTGIRALTAADVMSKPAVTAGPDNTLVEAMQLMTEHRNRHIPVVDEDRLVGLVSIGDAVKYRLDEAEMELNAVRAYVTSDHERVS
jgi:CBS domain-containing protein